MANVVRLETRGSTKPSTPSRWGQEEWIAHCSSLNGQFPEYHSPPRPSPSRTYNILTVLLRCLLATATELICLTWMAMIMLTLSAPYSLSFLGTAILMLMPLYVVNSMRVFLCRCLANWNTS